MVPENNRRARMSLMAQPIDLYYWPTPNGWKITIFLEEAGLPTASYPWILLRATSTRRSS